MFYFTRQRLQFSSGRFFADSRVAETVAEPCYAPVSAPCSRQKSTHYKIRNRAKYIPGPYQLMGVRSDQSS